MPAILELSKKEIVLNGLKLVEEEGIDKLNARSLAKKIGISTKPLYRIYKNMDEIKNDLYIALYNKYEIYLKNKVDPKDPLHTFAVSYVEFACNNKNLFRTLFLSNNLNWKNLDEVLEEKWNRAIIVNLVSKQGLSFKDARNTFIDTWIHANGIATLLATNDIVLSNEEIENKFKNMTKEKAV